MTVIIALYKADITSPCNCSCRGEGHAKLPWIPQQISGCNWEFPYQDLFRTACQWRPLDYRRPPPPQSLTVQLLWQRFSAERSLPLSHTHTGLTRMYFWTKREFKDVNKLRARQPLMSSHMCPWKQFFFYICCSSTCLVLKKNVGWWDC